MFVLPIPVLFAITIVACCMRSVFSGCFSKKVSSDNYHTWFFGMVQGAFCLISIVGIFLVSGGLGSFSPLSLVLGALIGAADIFALVATLKAFSIGPFSYTVIITSLGSVIPTLSGYFFPNDPVPTVVQYVGVGLMVACLLMSPDTSKSEKEKKVGMKWLALSSAAAVCSGIIGVVQKIHQSSAYKDERAAMLIVAFAFSVAFSLIILLIEKRKEQGKEKQGSKLVLWGLPAIAGFVFAFQHTINLFLSALPAIIVFPLVNLCPMVLTMLIGFVVFKEKLTFKRWIGVIFGILSSILVSGII